MKRHLLIILFFFFALNINAQVRGNEIRVVVSPNHSDWKYKLNEPCEFNIQVYKAQNLLPDVVIDYELGPEMYPDVKKNNVLLKDGKITLTSVMKHPGFVRCKVRARVDGKVYEGCGAAGYDIFNIKPYAEMPSDFDLFWETSLKEAREIPLDPTFELISSSCTDKVNVYHVSFQNMRPGSRTYGILCVPKKSGKYPALLRVPGAGIRTYYGDIQTASKGVITLEIGIHGIPVTMSNDYYDKLSKGALYNYWSMNTGNRDEFYYKRVFIGALRAVDFICSLPEFNGQQLGVTGSSQGGALSFVTAALDSRVTFLAAVHPAMCDHTAFLHGQAGGWPHYFYYNPNPDKSLIDTSKYYDTVNFARKLKVPGWYSWGYNDEVCPPTSTYATYNIISAPKEIHPYLETGHYWYQEQYDEWNEWLWKMLGVGD